MQFPNKFEVTSRYRSIGIEIRRSTDKNEAPKMGWIQNESFGLGDELFSNYYQKDLNCEDDSMAATGICCEYQGRSYFGAETVSKPRNSAKPETALKAELEQGRKEAQPLDKNGSDPLYLIALTMIERVGPKTSRALLQHFGSAKGIFRATRQKLLRLPMVGAKIVDAIHNGDFLRAAESELEFANRHDVKVVTWNDATYPLKLRQVCDSPMVIYVKGELPPIDMPHVAVVGTRKPSSYGKKMAAEFAQYFAERGVVVVSGLAFGIDIEAHQASMASNGLTLAVLGHGLDLVYPKEHTGKAKQIVDGGGALITEFCSGTQPDGFNFPARNRIISGLCDAVVVVEATEKGGALITARMAFEQDREVFAVPGNIGSPTAMGCNRLIKDQIARIACGPEDVIDNLQHLIKLQLDDRPQRKANFDRSLLSHKEGLVYEAIGSEVHDFDQIATLSGIEGAELRSVLLGLEFRNLVNQVAGGKYRFAV